MKREWYIDNLRVLVTVFVLIPFHAGMCFNIQGKQNYLFFGESAFIGGIISLAAWAMPLIMMLAGASARFSLQRRTKKEFIKERIFRLFIPLLIGLIVTVAPLSYFADVFHNGYSGSFFEHFAVFFTKFTTLTGWDGGFSPGHLWFMIYLLVISLICLPLTKIKALDTLSKKANTAIVILLGLLPLAATPILNITGNKSVAAFILYYLIGYYLIWDSELVKRCIERYRVVYGIVYLIFCAVYLYNEFHTVNPIYGEIIHFGVVWFGVLSALGFGKRYLVQSGRIARFLASISFDFYLVHYPVLTAVQFFLYRFLDNRVLLFLAPIIITYPLCLILCALIMRCRKALHNTKTKATSSKIKVGVK